MQSSDNVLSPSFFYDSGKGFRKSTGVLLTLGLKGTCTCPNPNHEDQNPSAKMNDSGVYCFVCSRQYSVDYIAKSVGFDTKGYVLPSINVEEDKGYVAPFFRLLWLED